MYFGNLAPCFPNLKPNLQVFHVNKPKNHKKKKKKECVCGNVSFESIKSAVDFFLLFLDGSLDSVQAKFLRWRSYWLRHQSESLPNDALQALIIAEEMDSYLSLEILIEILATLPVTTATNERLFSALKYLKTFL